MTDLVREANITTLNCALSVPLRSSLVSLIEMPKVDDKQLASMIPLEARKYIPVPVSEVAMDWWVIPKEDDKYLDFVDNEGTKSDKKEKIDVLVASIHNEVLNRYNQIVVASHLKATFFEIEMFSSVRSIIDSNNTPVMIMDIGAASTKIYVVEKGVIRSSHIIGKGGQDFTSAIAQGMNITFEKAEEIKRTLSSQDISLKKTIKDLVTFPLDYIFSETNSALLTYQKRYNKSVDRVYLTGGAAALPDIAVMAKENLQIETLLGKPFDKVEAPAFLQDILSATGMDFAVAIGLALRKLQEIH